MTIFPLILALLNALSPVLADHATYSEITPCEDVQAGPCVMYDEGSWRLLDSPDARTHTQLATCPYPTRLRNHTDLCLLVHQATYYLKITSY